MKKSKRYYSDIFDCISLLIAFALIITIINITWDASDLNYTFLEFWDCSRIYIISLSIIITILMIKKVITVIYRYLTNTY